MFPIYSNWGQEGRLRAEQSRRGIEIDESTAVTRWAGESMDYSTYSTATEWLLNKDGIAI